MLIKTIFSAFTFRDEDKEEALRIALATFEDLKACTHSYPSHLTYGTMVKVINNLMKNDNEAKDQMMTNIFNKCCHDGQLGGFVLRCLEDALPPNIYLRLLRGSAKGVVSVNAKDLPKEWSQHVREKKSFVSRDQYGRQGAKRRQRKT